MKTFSEWMIQESFTNFELKNAWDMINSEFNYAKQKIRLGQDSDIILDKLLGRVKDHLLNADYYHK